MDKSIFWYDPLIGCPFDDSSMKLVQEWRGFKVGMVVEFRGPNKLGTMSFPQVRGEILAIGEDAKYLDGQPFVAFAIKVGDSVHFKTHTEVHHVI